MCNTPTWFGEGIDENEIKGNKSACTDTVREYGHLIPDMFAIKSARVISFAPPQFIRDIILCYNSIRPASVQAIREVTLPFFSIFLYFTCLNYYRSDAQSVLLRSPVIFYNGRNAALPSSGLHIVTIVVETISFPL